MDTERAEPVEQARVEQELDELLGMATADLPPDVPLLGLGLDSLRAVQLCDLLARRGVPVSLEDLLLGMTLGELRDTALASASHASAVPDPDDARLQPDAADPTLLTMGEASLYFMDKLTRAPDQVNAVTVALWLPPWDEPKEPDPVARVQDALRRLGETHPALRTRFVEAAGEPRRTTHASVPTLSVEVWDELTPSAVADFVEKAATRRLTPEDDTWWDATLVHDASGARGQHLLVVRCHHVLVDLWSLEVLRDDLLRLLSDPAAVLEPTGPGMAGIAQRERACEDRLRVDVQRWRERLDGVPHVLAVPLDRPRPPVQRCHGSALTHRVDADVAEQLRQLALRWEMTFPSLLAAAWAAVLSRYCGQHDFLLGDVYAGRSDPSMRRVVGYLADVVPCRVQAGPEDLFETVARAVARERAWGIRHRVPFARLVQELSDHREPGAPTLCQAMFSFQRGGGQPVDREAQPDGRYLAVDLLLEVRPDEGGIVLTLDHAVDVVERSSAQRILQRVAQVLERLVEADREVTVRELVAVPSDAYAAGAPEPGPRSAASRLLHAPVLEHAARTPHAPAVEFGGALLDYAGLVGKAAGVARALTAAGASLGDSIAVVADREPALVVGALGTMLAGCGFAPLAPALPRERLLQAWRRLGEGPVLAGGSHLDIVSKLLPDSCIIDVDAMIPAAGSDLADVATDDPAYVLHTSGSTGEPKAVVVSHRAITNMFADFQSRGLLGPAPAGSWWCDPGFDVSIYEMFLPLREGGCLAIVPDEIRVDAEALVEWMVAREVSACFVPPFLLGEFVDALKGRNDVPLRRVLVGVEPIPGRLLLDMAEALPEATIVNAYGPTETAVMCTAMNISGACVSDVTDQAQPTPIGLPMAGARITVVDPQGHPVPHGALGELVVGGEQVSDGYLGSPGTTAQRFVPDPGGPPGSRSYRTGDLVRVGADGLLRFQGRADRQVKVNGRRVEPGEVEHVLAEHVLVLDALVLPLGSPVGSLAAFVRVAPTRPADQVVADVLAHARRLLPSGLVPSRVEVLERWPVTPSGKVDHRELLRRIGRADSSPSRQEATPELARLTQILAEELGVPTLRPSDNVFSMGAHSLVLTGASYRFRTELGLDVPVGLLFQHQTIEELWPHVRDRRVTGVVRRRERAWTTEAGAGL